MKPWTLPLTALVAALIGAGIAVGVMLWEPWQDDGPTLADRVALCDRTFGSSGLRDSCNGAASISRDDWECFIKYPDSPEAIGLCRD